MSFNRLHHTVGLFGDTFFYTLAKLIPGLLTLVSVGVFIRVLGPENYGYWAICNALMMFILSLCFGWIRQSILRFKSGEDERINFGIHNSPVDSILFGTLLVLLIGFPLLLSLRFLFGYTWITLQVAFLVLLFTISFGVFNTWSSFLQAWRHRTAMVLAETFKAVIAISSAICLAFYWGVTGVLAGYAFGTSVVAFLLGVLLKKLHLSESIFYTENIISERKDNWITWWSYGWPVSLWLALISFIPIADRILIQYFLGSVESGVYAASYDIIVRGYSLFLFPMTLAVHPRIMAACNSGNSYIAFQQITHAKIISFIILAMSVLGILVIYPIFFKYLVKVDAQKELSRMVLSLITIGGGLWQVALLAHKPMEIAQKTKLMINGLLLSLIANISIQIALLKIIGVLATALALVLSAIIYICFCETWAYKSRYKHI